MFGRECGEQQEIQKQLVVCIKANLLCGHQWSPALSFVSCRDSWNIGDLVMSTDPVEFRAVNFEYTKLIKADYTCIIMYIIYLCLFLSRNFLTLANLLSSIADFAQIQGKDPSAG